MSLVLIAAMIVLAVIAAAAVLQPLVRSPRQEATRQEHDITVYRDQLDEVERELSAGRIQPAQAAAARAEIERRILRTAEAAKRERAATSRRMPSVAAWALAAVVPLCATAIYLGLGTPGMPDVPYASRATSDPRQVAQRQDFERLTNQLAERLRKGEGDLTGWIMLARSYGVLGRTDKSVAAFRKAIEMAGGTEKAPPALLADFGEALFQESGGQVPPDARAAFETALKREPQLFKARHYMAVAHLQAGEPKRALAIWRGIEADSPSGAPWLPELRTRIDALAGEIGVAASDVAPERVAGGGEAASLPPASDIQQPGARGPSRSDMEAAAGMSPEERGAFIRGMVERLASRLKESPDDPEGWARLARAYSVLGEAEKAEDARSKAVSQYRERLDSLPSDSPERAAIEARLAALQGRS